MRLLLEVSRSQEGRLEGTIQSVGHTERSPFSGTLELLRVLEDAIDEADRSEVSG